MEDSDMKAIREIANGMEYIASEAVDKAPYDVTRNARITKVYYDEFEAFYIIGYDVTCDGKSYHIDKERGKGINAKENDIIKLHIPCNNMNNMYLSYAHDPEDFVKYFVTIEGADYSSYWNSGLYEQVLSSELYNITFPATTNQYSSVSLTMNMTLPKTNGRYYSFIVTADNGVTGKVMNYNVDEVTVSTPLIVKFSNENPINTAITKGFNYYIKAIGLRPSA